jgi:hypothetical protein
MLKANFGSNKDKFLSIKLNFSSLQGFFASFKMHFTCRKGFIQWQSGLLCKSNGHYKCVAAVIGLADVKKC